MRKILLILFISFIFINTLIFANNYNIYLENLNRSDRFNNNLSFTLVFKEDKKLQIINRKLIAPQKVDVIPDSKVKEQSAKVDVLVRDSLDHYSFCLNGYPYNAGCQLIIVGYNYVDNDGHLRVTCKLYE